MKVKKTFLLFKPFFKKNSISTRLLSYILLCSTALTLVITLTQLMWDFQQDVKRIEASINQIESSFLQPIATSLWNLDDRLVKIQVEGIMSLSGMQYVLIQEVLGSNSEVPLVEQGTLKEKFDISKKFDLIYQGEIVGTLFVATSLDKVYDRLIEKSLLILVSQSIKTMVVSICILLIIYYMVIRHINKISLYTHNIKLSKHKNNLILEGRRQHPASSSNELDELVYLCNKMQKRIVAESNDKEIVIEELQQERDFSGTIINVSNTVICCLDSDFRISSINPAAVILTRYSQEELIKKNWLDIFVLPERREELLGKLAKNEPIQSIEIEMRNKVSEEHTLVWTFSDFYDGPKLKYLIGFGHDITRQKQVELEITLLNEQLEEKVKIRTAALLDSNKLITQNLEQLKRTQQTLLESEKMASLGGLVAGVAHEINTPLGITVTAASFLQGEINQLSEKLSHNTLSRSYLEGLVERLRESDSLINSNLNRAADLISSFKQVAVDSSTEECYSFNLEENVHQVVSSLKYNLKQAHCNVFIDCPEDLFIYSFPGSFVQIYSNLILNSLIHGFDDWAGKREIYIDIELQGQSLNINYRDTGKGIPDDIAERIFEPFVTSKRGSGGCGLGANIVYNIVNQLLKGDIQYVLTDEGAYFKIVIPYTETMEGPAFDA